ncbi:MAG: transposase [Patescibacteria group bacterium]|nr:transposase [Patescibacteria group bacterium]MDD4610553.1 transposase [Patescibacteria group bacterium]
MDKWDYIRFLESTREFNCDEPIGSLYLKKYLAQKNKVSQGVGHPIGCPTPKQEILVEYLAYCLLPNHFHFLIIEKSEGGIPKFMKRLSGGYTNYFNKKYLRTGSLFQGKYKIFEVKYSHFLKLSVYVNCNAEVHKINRAENWPWSSYLDYINERNGTLCN